jgi:quercetin dioxygenase-like cupin family protein
MEQRRINFDSLGWESQLPGARYKAFQRGGTMVRVAEYTRDFVAPDWCTDGHVGYVLEGELDIDFDGEVVRFSAGDGLFIPEGEESRHKPTAVSDVVRVVLVERV